MYSQVCSLAARPVLSRVCSPGHGLLSSLPVSRAHNLLCSPRPHQAWDQMFRRVPSLLPNLPHSLFVCHPGNLLDNQHTCPARFLPVSPLPCQADNPACNHPVVRACSQVAHLSASPLLNSLVNHLVNLQLNPAVSPLCHPALSRAANLVLNHPYIPSRRLWCTQRRSQACIHPNTLLSNPPNSRLLNLLFRLLVNLATHPLWYLIVSGRLRWIARA